MFGSGAGMRIRDVCFQTSHANQLLTTVPPPDRNMCAHRPHAPTGSSSWAASPAVCVRRDVTATASGILYMGAGEGSMDAIAACMAAAPIRSRKWFGGERERV